MKKMCFAVLLLCATLFRHAHRIVGARHGAFGTSATDGVDYRALKDSPTRRR